MGGVNCPPPLTDAPEASVVKGYVTSLAHYCNGLFSGTAAFFAANAKIEQAVLGEVPIDDAVQLLIKSEDDLEVALSRIGSVANLYGQIDPDHTVSFGDQHDKLSEAVEKVRTARMELALLAGEADLQDELWKSPELTDNFVVAMNAIAATNSWQSTFATSYTLAVV